MKVNVRSPTILSSLLEKLRRLAKERSVMRSAGNIVDKKQKKEIIMILKRKLVTNVESTTQEDGLLGEALFSNIDRASAVKEIYGNDNPQSRRVFLEIMKTIEMYDIFADGRNLRHWIDKTVTAIIKVKNMKVFKGQTVFSPIDWSKAGEEVLGWNILSEISEKYRTPENMIEQFVIHQLLTERNSGDIKYGTVISGRGDIYYTPKQYLQYYKYIGLCVSGQLDPYIQDFKSSGKFINTTEIDYSRKMEYNEEQLKRVISKCIVNIKGYEVSSISRYLR